MTKDELIEEATTIYAVASVGGKPMLAELMKLALSVLRPGVWPCEQPSELMQGYDKKDLRDGNSGS